MLDKIHLIIDYFTAFKDQREDITRIEDCMIIMATFNNKKAR